MDPEKRIEQLEAEVRELTAAVRDLLQQRDLDDAHAGRVQDEAAPEKAKEKPEKARQQYSSDVSRNVDKVLGGEPGEALESRIGGIWLSRVAVVMLMTALVLGARMTLRAESLQPLHRVAMGYGVALVGLLYGLAFRNRRDFFSQSIFGAGLACVYFTTYAAFFVEGMTVMESRAYAGPVLMACLGAIALVAHRRKSQTVAGVSLFLAYYTVVLSCMDGHNAENITYALGVCALLAVVALAFHAAHRWFLFTWVAMIATQLTYIYFFLRKPAALHMSDLEYFWVSNGYLALCWIVFSLACIVDARKTGEYRRVVAPMSGVNSCVFFALAWIAIRQNYIEYEWAFRLGICGMLFLFSVLTHLTGPRWNYLFQVFIAKTVIMFTLALQAYLSGEKLMVALALQGLGLGFSYKRAMVPIFKILGLGLLLVTFAGCLVSVRSTDVLIIGPCHIKANWFCCVGAPLVFAVVAWFYEHFIRPLPPEKRVVSGQWIFADSRLDLHGATVALLYAAAGAFILLAVTIIDLGDHPALPYMLGAEGVAMAVLGVLLRTPQVEVGSVLLVVAAHVCYHVFLFLRFGPAGFEDQVSFELYTVLLGLFTYVGAYFWERYLRRVKGGHPWEHDLAAAAPYLAATFMLTTLMSRSLDAGPAAVGQCALGAALFLVSCLTAFNGMKASGVMAFVFGAATFYQGLYAAAQPIAQDARFLAYLALIVAACVIGERFLAGPRLRGPGRTRTDDLLRVILIGACLFLVLIGLREWNRDHALTLYWLAVAVITMALGALFRESRYRWGSMIVFAIVIGRAFVVDLLRLDIVYQFMSFAGLAAALLVVSWIYSERRRRVLESRHAEEPKDSASGQ